MKSILLHRVKRSLYELKDTDVSISSIAAEYHFWHMGQFAKDFKKKFGQLPSELLKK